MQNDISHPFDVVGVLADHRRRERASEMTNAQAIVVNVNCKIFGSAGSAIRYSTISGIDFEAAFCPVQGGEQGIPPAVTFGFEIAPNTPPVLDVDIPGLIGHAHVKEWIRDDNGYYVGASVNVGVVNMSNGVTINSDTVPFKGMLHMHFSGTAITLPIDIPEYGDD